MSEQITGSLQENLLTLAVFDTSSLPLLTSTLEVGMFENDFYRNIIRESFQYYKEFKQAPGEHISDLFETHLTKKASEKEAKVYERILQQLFHNKDNVNRDYVLAQLNKFIRQATLKDGITAAHQLVKDGKLDEAETKLSTAIHSQIKIFEPGLWLTDTGQSLKFLTNPTQPYPLGIKPLDDIGFGPAPGQLLVILSPANRGKSVLPTARIWTPSHGYVPMQKLIDGEHQQVYSVHKTNKKVGLAKVEKVFDSGIKPTCKIHLRSGRIIEGLADTHPVLTWNGYVPCKDLKVGDFTIGACVLPLTGTATQEEIAMAYVIGAFIGDGSLTNKTSPILALSTEKLDIYDYVVSVLSPRRTPICRPKGEVARDFRFHTDTRDLLAMWGMEHERSVDKFVPKRIFSLGEEAVAACLAGLFDTDGSIYNSSNSTKLEFSTSSYQLSEDILTMLNVLGIYAARRQRIVQYNGKSFSSWAIILNDEETRTLFVKRISPYMHHELKLKRIGERVTPTKITDRGCFYKRLPYLAAQLIVDELAGSNRYTTKSISGLWRHAANNSNQNFARCASEYIKNVVKRKNRLPLEFSQKAAEYLQNKELTEWSRGDFVFDEIMTIEWDSPQNCWDLQVEEQYQSFLCEHVFTHNSMFCIHIAKMCAMQRLKVLYISLEMSQDKLAQRFFQSLFAVTKRQAEIIYTKFELDELDRLNGFRIESLQRPSLKDEGIEEALKQKMAAFKNRFKIYIKRFPTNALSIKGLEAYLDGMERFYNFVPDILLIDYADLLQLDANNLRISTGGVYKDLRRIAVERNFAVVSPSQANRLSEDAKVISLKFLAEDYSKAAIADDIVAYCQTSLELRLGLARLFVAKARDEEREQTILISQSYKMAQFCVDATQISDRYWSLLDAHNNPNDAPPETPIARTPIKRRNIR